jgi:hypothetical protein
MSFNSPFTGQVIQPTDVSYRSIALTENTTLSWPLNGNVDGNYVARIMNVTPSAAGFFLYMPPANQASVGQDSLISNVGSFDFFVVDYDGNSIVVIPPGESKYIFIETNANTAGTWGVVEFGATNSGAVASLLAGYGLTAIGSTLNTEHLSFTTAGSYIVLVEDRAKSAYYAGGAGNFVFQSAVDLTNGWFIFIRNGGTGALTLVPASGETINGEATLALQPGDSAIVCCDGSGLFTIGLGRNTLFNFTQNTKAVTSGTYTLSAVEASSAIQKFTGTLTDNVTIVLPQTIAVYYITNQTVDVGPGYTLTFTTGAIGGATATVLSAQQVILVCDSVNLYNGATIAAGAVSFQLTDGTVSAPSLSFATEVNTGIYRPASGQLGIAVLGNQIVDVSASGLEITGSGTFTTGVSGGTF